MADRWDYYEVAFSLAEHLNEDDALVIFNELDDDDRILGAAFSCGNDSAGHPFNEAALKRATEAVLSEFQRIESTPVLDDERQGDESPEGFVARRAVETALKAIYATPLPSRETDLPKEGTDAV